MPSESELFSNATSKATYLDGVCISCAEKGGPVNIRLNTLDGLKGIKSAPFHPVKILADIIALNLAR